MNPDARPRRTAAPAVELDRAGPPPATVLLRGARLLDPRAGLDGGRRPPDP